MPAKGSKLSIANRDYVYNMAFYKKNLVEKHGVKASFKECKDLIEDCNKIIAEIITNEDDGFKLSHGLGYLVTGRFKPAKAMIDWPATHKLNKPGKKVYFTNSHSLGYSPRVYWFRVGRISNLRLHEALKFVPYKTLSQANSKRMKNGHLFNEWTVADFVEKSRLEKLYSKKYRKELND